MRTETQAPYFTRTYPPGPLSTKIKTKASSKLSLSYAQILLTIDVMLNRPGLKNTVVELLKLDTVPIFNENDAVNISKAKFGDNDQLAAHVAGIVGADICVLFTDVR